MTFGEQVDFSSRLTFLYKAVDDTQSTIRFIDAKAAFCVTLLSCMVAGSLLVDLNNHSPIHRFSFYLFLISVGLSLLICLRVIFPVIKPQITRATDPDRALPKYFIHQKRSHHWIRHIFSNSVDDVLDDDNASYPSTLLTATDADLFSSMCNELLLVSLIRQIKSDRLQSVVFPLIAAIVCFVAMMVS